MPPVTEKARAAKLAAEIGAAQRKAAREAGEAAHSEESVAASSGDEYSSDAEALRREPLARAEALRLRAASPLRFKYRDLDLEELRAGLRAGLRDVRGQRTCRAPS